MIHRVFLLVVHRFPAEAGLPRGKLGDSHLETGPG